MANLQANGTRVESGFHYNLDSVVRINIYCDYFCWRHCRQLDSGLIITPKESKRRYGNPMSSTTRNSGQRWFYCFAASILTLISFCERNGRSAYPKILSEECIILFYYEGRILQDEMKFFERHQILRLFLMFLF